MMLADNIRAIKETLQRESASSLTLPKIIAVTKTVSTKEMFPLSMHGIQDVGENRVQTIMEKMPEIKNKFQIHMIGRLQRNKIKYIINEVCLIHSVDTLSLAQEIDKQAAKHDKIMPILLQVNVSGETQKAGVSPQQSLQLFTACDKMQNLRVKGLMTVLPIDANEEEQFRWFSQTKEILEQVQQVALHPKEVTELSMGMSRDYVMAVRAGSTMVRIGTSLFR